MYLKRIKLRNFKSFAGATEIPFQPGFTGVAGPNGMGKSNISDAILFVLGPTSSKALRADRLTSLFFNGGSSKKAATECEVSLVFDNSDRLLPSESSDVEVTRYVKLAPSDPEGYYSYFYVNGKRSTQTEIDSLLSHARLSGDGYNLVQQGDVNKIVTMGAVPRRGLVERLRRHQPVPMTSSSGPRPSAPTWTRTSTASRPSSPTSRFGCLRSRDSDFRRYSTNSCSTTSDAPRPVSPGLATG